MLLFPHPEAPPLDYLRDGDPLTLIVPDGTWSQAVRTRRRIPGLRQHPLRPPARRLVSQYRLRHAPRAGQVSTLEAIAHALGILEVRVTGSVARGAAAHDRADAEDPRYPPDGR